MVSWLNHKQSDDTEVFPSKVYYDSIKIMSKPTFTFIHEEKNYGLPQLFRMLRKKPVKYFFIIINGQQIPTFDAGVERDRLFGQPLTGIHRILEKGIWQGKCRVQKELPSVAKTIWETYGESAVILDILNPKYEWQDFANENIKALKYVVKLVSEITKTVAKSRNPLPRFFVTGYSRGGVFALKLTGFLKAIVPVEAIVTLDPVISEIREADTLCVGWGIKERNRWRIVWEEKLIGIHLNADSFPILKNPEIPCYNVFQRRSFLALNSVLEKPIGSAVFGAECPSMKSRWNIKPLGTRSPFNQYDTTVERHSEVLEKYSEWVIDIAKQYCPLS